MSNVFLGRVKCSDSTISELTQTVYQYLNKKVALSITCINAHIFNLAQKDESLRNNLNNSSIVTADGMAIVWAARFLGQEIKERCNMTEAFRAFLESTDFSENRAILIGCTNDELDKAVETIHATSSHCRVIKAIDGYKTNEEYYELLNDSDVDLVFIGAGTPRSEELVHLLSKQLPQTIVWHIGGGTIKMLAGTMIEAPLWMRKAGLQWLHRLFNEPITLWKRYLIGNPLFIWNILKIKVKRHFHTPSC